ncbi:MAG: DUF3040 domain-containing protein [Actinomycetota bacterium]|nr:DUF3040 domain-containing protein [Actinomycetota bacterium]
MPLSEHEQRLLDQIERALYAEDPKFASAVRATDPRNRARRRLWQAALLFVLGISLLFAGVIVQQAFIAVGVAGFLIMFASAVLAATSWKRMNGREPLRVVGSDRPAKARARRPSVLDRMEQRWHRRDEGRGR